MARITFSDSTYIDVRPGTNLMEAIIQAKRPIGNSCDGTGICGKCFVRIVSGMEKLSAVSRKEKELLVREKFGEGFRMSCLVKVEGDVTVTTTYW